MISWISVWKKQWKLGATGVINGAKEDVIAKVRELTGGLGTDIVIETAGTQITTSQAIHIAKKGSTIVLGWIQQNRRTYTSCKSCTG